MPSAPSARSSCHRTPNDQDRRVACLVVISGGYSAETLIHPDQQNPGRRPPPRARASVPRSVPLQRTGETRLLGTPEPPGTCSPRSGVEPEVSSFLDAISVGDALPAMILMRSPPTGLAVKLYERSHWTVPWHRSSRGRNAARSCLSPCYWLLSRTSGCRPLRPAPIVLPVALARLCSDC